MPSQFENSGYKHSSFAPYTKQIGELALAWNALHESLAELFWSLVPIPNGFIAYAIWYSIKSDRAQRDMISALSELYARGHDIPDNARTEIKWLLGRINSLEDFRNDVLHTPLYQAGSSIIPYDGMGHRRAKKLSKKKLLPEIDWFYDATVILSLYAAELAWYLDKKESGVSLPERPKLPNRGDSNPR